MDYFSEEPWNFGFNCDFSPGPGFHHVYLVVCDPSPNSLNRLSVDTISRINEYVTDNYSGQSVFVDNVRVRGEVLSNDTRVLLLDFDIRQFN